MINLYNYHSNPSTLNGYNDRMRLVPEEAYEYALKKQKRIPELEPIIMKDLAFAYRYAKNIIKSRWPEAESLIMKNSAFAYGYAKYIIKGRWLEAEPYVMKNPYWGAFYKTEFDLDNTND